MSSQAPKITRQAEISTIVLLPGLDGTGELFSDFVAQLSSAVRPVVVRYPGSCRSYRQVALFLQSSGLDAKPIFLLGESFSSMASIAWAAANPAKVRGLIISAGFATPPVRRWLRPVSFLLSYVFFALPRPMFLIKYSTTGLDAPPGLIQQLKRIRGTVSAATIGARLRAVLTCDVRRQFSTLQIPILLLHAQQDRLVGKAKLAEMRRIQPNAEVDIFPGSHMILQRSPATAAKRIERFICNCIDREN